jgi:hypothetical protein
MSQGDQGSMRRNWPIQAPETPTSARTSGATQQPEANNAARAATVSADALPPVDGGSRGVAAVDILAMGQAAISCAVIW